VGANVVVWLAAVQRQTNVDLRLGDDPHNQHLAEEARSSRAAEETSHASNLCFQPGDTPPTLTLSLVNISIP